MEVETLMSHLKQATSGQRDGLPWLHERYLVPILEEDAMLLLVPDGDDSSEEDKD